MVHTRISLISMFDPWFRSSLTLPKFHLQTPWLENLQSHGPYRSNTQFELTDVGWQNKNLKRVFLLMFVSSVIGISLSQQNTYRNSSISILHLKDKKSVVDGYIIKPVILQKDNCINSSYGRLQAWMQTPVAIFLWCVCSNLW